MSVLTQKTKFNLIESASASGLPRRADLEAVRIAILLLRVGPARAAQATLRQRLGRWLRIAADARVMSHEALRRGLIDHQLTSRGENRTRRAQSRSVHLRLDSLTAKESAGATKS